MRLDQEYDIPYFHIRRLHPKPLFPKISEVLPSMPLHVLWYVRVEVAWYDAELGSSSSGQVSWVSCVLGRDTSMVAHLVCDH
jgi:hypothetical protein